MNFNFRTFRHLLLLTFCLVGTSPVTSQIKPDSLPATKAPRKMDVGDLFSSLFSKKCKKDSLTENETCEDTLHSTVFSVLPYLNYSLVTSLAFGSLVNTSFYAGRSQNTSVSSLDLLATYTLRKQLIVRLKSNLWLRENNYNLVGDWRFMKYPSFTYGLGPHSSHNDRVLIDYSYLRFYQNLFRKLAKGVYLGIGYRLDYHYGVAQHAKVFITDFDRYEAGNQARTVASGFAVNALYDTRRNMQNPVAGGYYGYLSYRCNTPILGSDKVWESVLLDARKYILFPHSSTNILALWTYNWFTFGGEAPYLDLPSTGWDYNDNQGRGYLQGRFRSKNLVSAEAEYRFGISRNKLVGGVVFVNAQSVSGLNDRTFKVIYPAAGVGIRLKFNKRTNTNMSVDYGMGLNGARSVFFNLGEVF